MPCQGADYLCAVGSSLGIFMWLQSVAFAHYYAPFKVLLLGRCVFDKWVTKNER